MSKNQYSILIIDKNSTIESKNIKDFDESTIYKKCGFKNDNNFSCLHKWILEKNEIAYIKLFGKNKGRSNFENKYEFPDPVNELIFGTAVLIAFDQNNQIVSLSKEYWEMAIVFINKGFDNLEEFDSDDENEEHESEHYSLDQLTKHGYVKDDFIVDSDEDDEDIEEEEFCDGELVEEEYQY